MAPITEAGIEVLDGGANESTLFLSFYSAQKCVLHRPINCSIIGSSLTTRDHNLNLNFG